MTTAMMSSTKKKKKKKLMSPSDTVLVDRSKKITILIASANGYINTFSPDTADALFQLG